MKKYIGFISKIVVTLMLIASVFFLGYGKRTWADAGYHSSYSGGSSHSSSSHSSSHSSSSSHYSSSSHSSSHSSSSSSGDDSVGGVIFIAIIILVIIIYSCTRGKGGSSTNDKLTSNANAINKLKTLVPDFDEKVFLQNGYQMFLDIEDAWMNFNMEKVRNSITDEMFNMYESQLSSMEIKGEQNIMNGFVLKDSSIANCVQQGDNIEVTAKYIIEFYDYIIEKETGRVLRGSKTNKLRMYYDFTFIMSSTQAKVDKCPNCGADVNVNSAGYCEYCNSKIIGENTTWVMSKKVCTRQINL